MEIRALLAFVRQPLREITLGDLRAYQDTLGTLSTATQRRRLTTIKSLLSFGQKSGYLVVNAGTVLRLPAVKHTLAERILDEDAVLHMVAIERSLRNKTILRLLYLAGLRVSELCAIKVCDLQPRDDTGQITVFGKGGKTQVVLLKRICQVSRHIAVRH